MKYFIGVDLGTSCVKAILFSQNGEIIKKSSYSYPLYQPNNGWAEQDPQDWKNGTFTVIKEIAKSVESDDILAIGVSGQMHGLVALDKNGKTLGNSIIWCDGRTKAEVDLIEKVIGKQNYIESTLNAPNASFTLSKLLWLKNNEPIIYNNIYKVLLPKDYINYELTGNFSTDVSDASGTGYFDVKNRNWNYGILEKFDINPSVLPDIFESCQPVGTVKKAVANELGLSTNTVVAAGAGDQAACALGNGVLKENMSSISLGTSGVVFTALDKPYYEKRGSVHTFCHAVPNMWHVMGVTQACGLSVSWFKDNFAKNYSFDELNSMSEKADTTNLIYLPYLMGERTPHLDMECRGSFTGLSANHNVFSLYKALLEGVCFSLKDCMQIIEEFGIKVDNLCVSGGGVKSQLWLSILSNTLDKSLSTIKNPESGALGSAILASVSCGCFENVELAYRNMSSDDEGSIVNPNSNTEYKKELNNKYSIYKKLYGAIKSAY